MGALVNMSNLSTVFMQGFFVAEAEHQTKLLGWFVKTSVQNVHPAYWISDEIS